MPPPMLETNPQNPPGDPAMSQSIICPLRDCLSCTKIETCPSVRIVKELQEIKEILLAFAKSEGLNL